MVRNLAGAPSAVMAAPLVKFVWLFDARSCRCPGYGCCTRGGDTYARPRASTFLLTLHFDFFWQLCNASGTSLAEPAS